MHPVAQDLELYALKKLAPAKSSSIETHLESCNSCRERFLETEHFSQQVANVGRLKPMAKPADQRRSRRIPTDDPAEVKIFDADGEVSVDGRVLDASAGGLCVQVPQPVRPGVMVHVHLANTIGLGEVRYCVAGNGVYRLGVQINDVLQKEPEQAERRTAPGA